MTEITRKEVEQLKADWADDPIWDIEGTEGFEAYRDELKAFSDAKRAEWDAKQEERERKSMDEIQRRADALGCSAGVMQHILTLETTVHKLQNEVRALLDHSPNAQRNLSSY